MKITSKFFLAKGINTKKQKVNALSHLIQDYLNKYELFILIDDSDEVLNTAKNLGYHNIICIKIGESERYESYPNIYEAALAIREQ